MVMSHLIPFCWLMFGLTDSLWSTLPCRIKHLVLSRLSLPTVLLFGQTSASNYRIAKSHCHHRVHFVISSFNLDPVRTLAMLHLTDSLISGSAALLILAPFDHHFQPSDLDVYVPTERAVEVHRYLVADTSYIPADSLEACGYIGIPALSSSDGPRDNYPGVSSGLSPCVPGYSCVY